MPHSNKIKSDNALLCCEICGKAKGDVGGEEKPSLCLSCQKVWQHLNDLWDKMTKEEK